jgi:hypothetical protein
LVFGLIASLRARVSLSPTTRFLFVCGDFHCHAPGEGAANLLKSGLATSPRSTRPPTTDALLWGKALSNLTELAQQQFTRFVGFTNPILARIDRCYTSLPPWALLQQQLQATTSWAVATNHAVSLRNHSPISISISVGQQLPRDKRSLLNWLVVHPVYIKTVVDMQNSSELASLRPFERLKRRKTILRDASSTALRTILQDGGRTQVEELQVLATTARDLAQHDGAYPHSDPVVPHLGEVVDVVDDQVVLRPPQTFREFYGSAMRSHLAEEPQQSSEVIPRKKCARASRCTAIRRWRKLRAPYDARLTLVGISHNGHTEYCPVAQDNLLAAHWGRVFSAEPIDDELAKHMISTYQPAIQFNHVLPPSTEDIASTIRMSRRSSPGPDGLPFLAWAATGQKDIETLFHVMASLLKGSAPLSELAACNLSFVVFPPKGELTHDVIEVVRDPAATRPINLKNTDNKLIDSTICLVPSLPERYCEISDF